MSASDDFAKFLDTVSERIDVGPVVFMLALSDATKRAIISKFEDLEQDVIREYEALEAESRQDGRL